MNGLVSARSGLPINMLAGTDIALSATPSQRPNVVGEHRLSTGRSRQEKVLAWFNRAAFAQPAAGTFGNLGRNALLGPNSSTANLGLFKNFALPGREALRLQFRSEFFSVLNRPNFGDPETRVNAGARMGQITSAGGARVIQGCAQDSVLISVAVAAETTPEAVNRPLGARRFGPENEPAPASQRRRQGSAPSKSRIAFLPVDLGY